MHDETRMNDGTTIEATFCFVDIAGYTALTDTHGERAAADLVDDFADLIRTAVEPLGHLQSLVGDCAFFVFSDPVVAKNALLALYSSIADRQNFPVVRAGLHHGAALIRANRHFGSTINIAARVAAQATGGQILCTKCVAEILDQPHVLVRPEVRRSAEHHVLKEVRKPLPVRRLVLAAHVIDHADMRNRRSLSRDVDDV